MGLGPFRVLAAPWRPGRIGQLVIDPFRDVRRRSERLLASRAACTQFTATMLVAEEQPTALLAAVRFARTADIAEASIDLLAAAWMVTQRRDAVSDVPAVVLAYRPAHSVSPFGHSGLSFAAGLRPGSIGGSSSASSWSTGGSSIPTMPAGGPQSS